MIKLRNKRLIAKFVVVGTVGFVSNYAILELTLASVTNSKMLASVLAMAVTIQITFAFHDKWTYKRKTGYYRSLLRRYAGYLTTNSTGAVLTIVMFTILSTWLPNVIALGIAAVITMGWNFVMNLVIWKRGGSSKVDPEPSNK